MLLSSFAKRDGFSPPPIQVENPSSSEDIGWFRTYVPTTIATISAVLVGSSTPSVTFTVRYAADRSAAGTELLTAGRTVTSVTTGSNFTPDVTTIPADVWVWLETTAQSGTVSELLVAIDRIVP